MAVDDVNAAVAVLGDPRVVGHDDRRRPALLHLGADQLHHLFTQFGVERSLEQVLHGTWGKKVIEVDAANRPVRVIEEVPPINGFDVQLTIDLELQRSPGLRRQRRVR